MRIRSPSYIFIHKHINNTLDEPQCMKTIKGGDLIGCARTN